MARGDQIYVIREFLQVEGVYQHHGIDCGDGSVIHYRKTNETISRDSWDYFSGLGKIYVKTYQVCYIPEVVVQRAESRLGEKKYNLLFNNCEHFATWCKVGKSHSQQVQDFTPVISNIDPESLYQPLNRAFKQAKREDAPELLAKALADIRAVWERTQPVYQQAKQEQQSWQQVALKALQQGREDLARAALRRKLQEARKAEREEKKLQQLAKTTETLLRNSRHLQINLK